MPKLLLLDHIPLILRTSFKSNMATSFFRFKQFTVYHDKCAMKVGTDGVLLGAWATTSGKKNILDIGTGTGLIALMLAQRSEADIYAIDIDSSASIQAKENVEASPFANRIQVCHSSLSEFVNNNDLQFDLIVSNPPYFKASLLSPIHERNLARHNGTLSLESLIEDSLKLLAPEGSMAFILPYDQEDELHNLATASKLNYSRKTYVRPKPDADYKRILVEICKHDTTYQEDELIIEESRHQYTSKYIELTKTFYLKM